VVGHAYTPLGRRPFTARRLIMMDGADIYHALNRRLDLGEVIRRKVRYHTERRQPFARVTSLFPT
jgi:hypothetical protein